VQRVAPLRFVARLAVRVARAAGMGRLRQAAKTAAKLSWRQYAVKGVLVAATPQELRQLTEARTGPRSLAAETR
jgi:hypothetical protein